MNDFQSCTEKEFMAFLKSYPKPLGQNSDQMGMAPVLEIIDPTLGDWPKCVVARRRDPFLDGEKTRFEIRAQADKGSWG